MADDVIRAKRIELEDGNGDVRVVLDGGGSVEGFTGMVAYGPDGPVSAMTIGFANGSPSVFLQSSDGSTAQIIFASNGKPAVYLTDPEGNHKIIAP